MNRDLFPFCPARIWILTFACSLLVGDGRAVSHANESGLQVPAFTAYVIPGSTALKVSEEEGIPTWTDAAQSINWYGRFARTGTLSIQVRMRPASNEESKLRLSVAGKSTERSVPPANMGKSVDVDFGDYEIPSGGHHRLELVSLNPQGHNAGAVDSIFISGPAATDAHFNLKPRRNAASVHLSYPVPDKQDVEAFYCEMTGLEDPVHSYYMACGWHRGYFGMQVNSATERRIIFSVWDSGDEAKSRGNVQDENRVRLVDKGDGVYSGDFGNEGTGGHSHLKYAWRTGEVQRFLVTARRIEPTFTIYSGYYFHSDRKDWMLISSWKAPHEGKGMRGLYSFSENFVGHNGHLVRKARYHNQWVKLWEGDWIELTEARFTHDATGVADRFDRFMGLEEGQFFLSHGGFLDGFTESGTKLQRPPTGKRPQVLDSF